MPFRYDLSFVLLCIISFVVRFAAAGVLRNYTIGLADPFVTFSTGWNTATYAKGEYVFADRLGDRVLALLPANTVAVHYVGLKQDAGALYAACLNCHTADGSRFMLVDASERCEEPTTAILFSFSGLDPTQLHSLEVVNLEDPIFGFTSQITFGSFIVTVLQDDVVPTRQGQVGWLPAGLPSDGSVSKSLASTATAIITRRPSDTSASFTSTLRSSVVITTVSGSEPSHGDPLGTSTQTSPARGSLTSVLTSVQNYTPTLSVRPSTVLLGSLGPTSMTIMSSMPSVLPSSSVAWSSGMLSTLSTSQASTQGSISTNSESAPPTSLPSSASVTSAETTSQSLVSTASMGTQTSTLTGVSTLSIVTPGPPTSTSQMGTTTASSLDTTGSAVSSTGPSASTAATSTLTLPTSPSKSITVVSKTSTPSSSGLSTTLSGLSTSTKGTAISSSFSSPSLSFITVSTISASISSGLLSSSISTLSSAVPSTTTPSLTGTSSSSLSVSTLRSTSAPLTSTSSPTISSSRFTSAPSASTGQVTLTTLTSSGSHVSSSTSSRSPTPSSSNSATPSGAPSTSASTTSTTSFTVSFSSVSSLSTTSKVTTSATSTTSSASPGAGSSTKSSGLSARVIVVVTVSAGLAVLLLLGIAVLLLLRARGAQRTGDAEDYAGRGLIREISAHSVIADAVVAPALPPPRPSYAEDPLDRLGTLYTGPLQSDITNTPTHVPLSPTLPTASPIAPRNPLRTSNRDSVWLYRSPKPSPVTSTESS